MAATVVWGQKYDSITFNIKLDQSQIWLKHFDLIEVTDDSTNINILEIRIKFVQIKVIKKTSSRVEE